MKIRDFHITGQYPSLSVETEIEDDSQSNSNQQETVRLTLGPWNYVSLLNESELKSLVNIVYQKHQDVRPTQAMQQLKNTSFTHASKEELP
ncbi:hypothetical protein [Sulfobacillus harzensis]|uniref:Uncharacterized protein n=1 Tax=Sulfobacillus harzensis TaxID=2729629 RepID=A0A7Y0L171_9FIRM|nr:hypothetical protein [Sulfobacillus harzensis]NMP21112.1 hypothetical protein [Sulfobacillus harzensis]